MAKLGKNSHHKILSMLVVNMAKSTIISLILFDLYQQISYSTCCNDFLGEQPVSNSKGQTHNRGGGQKINETLIGGGSPRLFCTLPDPANVIFMLCFEIYDAVFFLRLCFKYSKFVNSCGLCEL